MRGTCHLQDQRLDLHGVLDTNVHLSHTTSGFKALVLKAITPFFKKKQKVRMVPSQITGTHGENSIGINW